MRAWVLNPETPYERVRAFVCTFDGGLYFLWKALQSLGSAKGGSRYLKLWIGKLMGGSDPVIDDTRVPGPDRNNSAAIVVTFKPDQNVLQNLEQHALNFEKIIIVDNSPKGTSEGFFSALPGRFTVIYNQNDFGLAGALNRGLSEICKHFTCEWIFFFDQDTTIDSQFLMSLKGALAAEGSCELGQTIYGIEHDEERLAHAVSKGKVLERVNSVITSGSFLRRESVLRIGAYIKEMFIDSLDHEYCLRAKRNGFQVKRVNLPVMKHRLGNKISVEMAAGALVKSDNHAAFRWFYFVRNLIFVGKEGFPSSFPWFLSHGFGLFKYFVKVVLFENDKTQKLHAALRGMRDGLIGRF